MQRTLKNKELVWGEGPKKPKLILVGESLGEQEEQLKRPFVGTDGKILDGIIASAGLRREDCYITNVVKVRPPANKVPRLIELDLTVEDFIPILKEELEAIDCNVCVPIGDLALNVICNQDEITKHRGSIYQSPLVPKLTCIPTLHPGYVREFWQARGVVVADFKKAQRIEKEGYKKVTFNTKTRPTILEVETFTENLLRQRAFSFDIETNMHIKRISCIGIGYVDKESGERVSMVIPLKHRYIPNEGKFLNYWNWNEELQVWYHLQRIFQSNLLKIGQNMNYDLTFLSPIIGEPAPPWFDLMVAHHTLDPELPHSLAFMTSIYTDIPYYKDDPKDKGDGWHTVLPSEVLWEYCGKDVEIPLLLEPLLRQELVQAGLLDFFEGYAMPLARAMWRVQRRGMLVDVSLRETMKAQAEEKLQTLEKELEAAIGQPLNVNSSKQMQEFLYKKLNLPVQYHRDTKRPTVNKETLEKLFAKYPNPLFKTALDIRELKKIISTYLSAPIDTDGRARTVYNICGTETGRSSSKKTYFGTGLDMQNVPRNGGIRRMFVATPGNVFLHCDLWQAEAYCVSVFAECRRFLDKLKCGEKIHSMVARWIFGKTEEDVISEEEYTIGKRIVHASNYGLQAGLLSVLIKKPLKEAKRLLSVYHNYAPEIEAWHRTVQEELARTRKLVTPFGRVRYFRNRYGEEMFREAYAHLPQSTIADYLHQALLKFEYCFWRDARVVQEGFDSMIIELNSSKVEEVKALLDSCFDKQLFWKAETFKIPYEIKEVAERWED